MGARGTGVRGIRRAGRLVFVALLCAAAHGEAAATISFAGDAARERFEAYVAFLERDPARFEAELATVRQLERSEVEYRFTVGGEFEWDVEGSLTTDGDRVLVNIAGSRGGDGAPASANSRIAHELEHARQFDDGEIAFEQDAASKRWGAHRASYDIGDEVKAWAVQLHVSVETDLWKRMKGETVARPSLLGEFAIAGTDEERARVLASRGYGTVRRVSGSDVAFTREGGYAARQLVRPEPTRRFFGRVRTVF